MKNDADSPLEVSPLSPAALHILLALANGERHGYAIMQEVAALTDDAIKMGPGTLYGSIKRLLAARLIEEAEERPDPSLDDERRRYYQLTPLGLKSLSAEIKRMESIVKKAKTRRLVLAAAILN